MTQAYPPASGRRGALAHETALTTAEEKAVKSPGFQQRSYPVGGVPLGHTAQIQPGVRVVQGGGGPVHPQGGQTRMPPRFPQCFLRGEKACLTGLFP